MQLYQLPYSHHCSKVRIAALEKGLVLDLPPIPGGSTRSPEFLLLNPLGQVPFLVDDQVLIGESEVIVEYLEDKHPEPPLLPREPDRRAQSRWLSRFHDLYLAKQLSTLYFGLVQGKGSDPAMIAQVDELMRLLDLLEAMVRPDPYFLGRQFALCDAANALSFWYATRLTKAYGREIPTDRIPRLQCWFRAISDRASVATVISECAKALGD